MDLIFDYLIGQDAEIDSRELLKHGDPEKSSEVSNIKFTKVAIRGIYQSSSEIRSIIEDENGQLHKTAITNLRLLR